MATREAQEYKMNPSGHRFYPMFLEKTSIEETAKVFNQVLIENIEYQRACAVAEVKMYDRILEIFKSDSIVR